MSVLVSERALIAPSILAADFARLGEEVRAINAAGADWIHLDIMDGHFAPNISFGPEVVRALRPCRQGLSTCPDDRAVRAVHRGVRARRRDLITIHAEAGPHLHRGLQTIRALGKRAGVAFNPGTPVQAIEPVLDEFDLLLGMSVNPGLAGGASLRRASRRSGARALLAGRDVRLEVDGGINSKVAPEVVAAGAAVLVAGSAIFGQPYYTAAIARLRPFVPC